MIHHFAHVNSDCQYGYQTSLHILGKDVFSELKEIWLPPSINILGQHCDWTKLSVDKVYLEQSEDGFIPDITLEIQGKKLYVEIYVTHKVDSYKLMKLIEQGISTIEVDLSKLDRDITKQDLINILSNKNEYSYWIFNKSAYDFNKQILSLIEAKNSNRYSGVDCPIGKRKSKNNFVFANFLYDCQHCKFCVKSKPEFRALCEKELNMINAVEDDIIDEIIDTDFLDDDLDYEDHPEYISFMQKIKNLLLCLNDINKNDCLCLGKHLIADKSDLLLSYEQRKIKYKNDIDNYILNLINMKCPSCTKDLVKDVNHTTGECFIRCSGFPYCKYSIDEILYENFVKDHDKCKNIIY